VLAEDGGFRWIGLGGDRSAMGCGGGGQGGEAPRERCRPTASGLADGGGGGHVTALGLQVHNVVSAEYFLHKG
jgi:hypothetical protein